MSKYDVSRFRNVTVALNTPFAPNGDVDLAAARKLTRYYIEKGVRSLYVCGSTGEGFLLDSRERMSVAEAVKEEAGDAMTIIVHVGCPDTRHSAELARHAEKPAQTLQAQFPASITGWVKKVYTAIGRPSQRRRICRFLFTTFLSSRALTFPWDYSDVCLPTRGLPE